MKNSLSVFSCYKIYFCVLTGKLQVMSILLRRLKSEGHRVLIFTQMTRMLDVLESFLSFHGHRYLRLDGTTKVEQRQVHLSCYTSIAIINHRYIQT